MGGSETLSFSGGYELAAGKPNPQIEPRSRNNNIITGYIYICNGNIMFSDPIVWVCFRTVLQFSCLFAVTFLMADQHFKLQQLCPSLEGRSALARHVGADGLPGIA